MHEEEWGILDPVGRLQLPQAHVNTLEMRDLVKVHMEPDRISVRPGQGAAQREPQVDDDREAADWTFDLHDGQLIGSMDQSVYA